MGVNFCSKISSKGIFFFGLTFTDFQTGHQELGIILGKKVFQKLKLSKNVNKKIYSSKLILLEKNQKNLICFCIENLLGIESQILALFLEILDKL